MTKNLRTLTNNAVGFWSGYDLLESTNGKKYEVILADPPWNYRDKASAGNRGASHKYPTMTIQDICALPVGALAARDCLLALWWVPPMPLEAMRVVNAWGFRFVNMMGFTWHKLTVNGKEHVGMGSLTRGNSESCIFAVRGRIKRIDASVRQHMSEKKGKHSEKPAETRRRLEKLMGNVKRVELFATESVPGWDGWGLNLKR